MKKDETLLADVNNTLWQSVSDDILMVLDLLEIPLELWEQYGTCYYRSFMLDLIAEHPESSMFQDAESQKQQQLLYLDALCASVPDKPRKAVEALSLAYGEYRTRNTPRGDSDEEYPETMRAALAKVCIGHALGHLDSKFDLVEMCRNAGAKGGGSNPKNKAANVIGDWAKKVSCDNGGRTDKAMARQIAENIPPHLKTDAELLKDLEGVVYRAIRSL